MIDLRAEARRALRTLARRPAFAVTAIGSLAIAIGLNTTMYSTLDALLSPRVELRDPGNLYHFRFFTNGINHVESRVGNTIMRSGGDVFESFTSSRFISNHSLLESDESFLNGYTVSVLPNYFNVIGARPMYGRVFDSTDVTAPSLPVMISERTARRLFPRGGDPVGRKIDVDGAPHTIIGVMARESGFPLDPTAAWLLPAQNTDFGAIGYDVVRARPKVTRAELQRTVHVLRDRFAIAAGMPSRDVRLAFSSAVFVQFHIGLFHYALIGAVLAVLLVACANIANLQLARGIARSRELATRAALGASRRDLVNHLVIESAILGAAGLTVGLVFTFWGMHLVRASVPDSIGGYIVEPQTSWHLFVFAAIATTVCVLFIGLLPGLRVSRVDLNELIKRGAGTGSTRSARRQYGILVAAEIGFALAVVCIAALLVRAAFEVTAESRVWDQSMLSDAFIGLKSADSVVSFDQLSADIVSRVRAHPDIADAAVLMHREDTDGEISATNAGGKPRVLAAPLWTYNVVTPGALRTLGLGVVHGRDFREGERAGGAIVDAQLARRLWPGASAVGQMIKFGSPDKPGRWYTVIGVRQPIGLESTQGPTVGEAYVLPAADDFVKGTEKRWRRDQFEVIVRANKNPQRTGLAVRRALAPDRRLTVWFVMSFDDKTGAAIKRANFDFVGTLFAVFALLATILAALGVYGIVAHAVAERKRELGVRIALGSSARGILHAVLREGNAFALGGVAVGLFLISRSAPLVREFLSFPEIDMYSIELYVPAAALLFAVALIAALIPALRATRIDPVEALRCE